jgi:predicted cobalt transporter CbtA
VLSRGVAAGLAAGLLAGVFFAVFAEPSLEAALVLGHDSHDAGPVVSRELQRGVGLLLAVGLAGSLLGALLATAVLVSRGRGSAPRRAVEAGVVLYVAITLAPWLKYPPSPPAVHSGAEVEERQLLYLLTICSALMLIWFAARVRAALAARLPERAAAAVAVTAFGLSLTALLVALPPAPEVVGLPAALVSEFRLSSLAGNTVLWLALTAGFALTSRPRRHRPAPAL